jgi:hypothetical protein
MSGMAEGEVGPRRKFRKYIRPRGFRMPSIAAGSKVLEVPLRPGELDEAEVLRAVPETEAVRAYPTPLQSLLR